MTYIYCSCGGRTAQGMNPVKFCAECGANLNQIFADNKTTNTNISPPSPPSKPKIHPKRQRIAPSIEENDNDDNDTDYSDYDDEGNINIPQLTARDVDFDIPKSGFVLNIAPNRKGKMAKLKKGKEIQQISAKELDKQLRKDCGPSKRDS